MPKERRDLIYPYDRMGGDVALSLADLRLDGSAPERNPIIQDFRTADVSAVAPDEWELLAVDIEAVVAIDEVEKLVEAGRNPTVVIAVDCPRTNFRRTVSCDHQGSGRWAGSLSLGHTQLAGQVLLRGVLAARVDDGHRREIGDSQLWTLHVDPPAIPIIEGNLPVRWIDFATAEVVPDGMRKDMFFADFSDDAPVVYLNSQFAGLPELLSDDENRPVAELALREAEYRRIATSVWIGMFNVATAAVELDAENESAEPALPLVGWQRSVLQTLMPRMYDESEAETLVRLLTARSGDEARDVQARAGAAIAQIVDQNGALKRRIRQLSLAGAEE
ncbi:MAG: hypothetical protein M3P00_11455 [Gemmatimonadota bacterium]|nr:hypothetical protein [Gemmatimonadota bacterium]